MVILLILAALGGFLIGVSVTRFYIDWEMHLDRTVHGRIEGMGYGRGATGRDADDCTG